MTGPPVAVQKVLSSVTATVTATSTKQKQIAYSHYRFNSTLPYAFVKSLAHPLRPVNLNPPLSDLSIHTACRSYSETKATMDVSAKAGHDMLSFINASPTREKGSWYPKVVASRA